MPNDVAVGDDGAPTKGADSASLLIERERDLLRIREDAARGVDVQATAITAATLALVAVAAGSDVLQSVPDGWIIALGVFPLLSALAGGIARLPAPPPLKSLVSRKGAKAHLALYATKAQPTMRHLGRDLGAAIKVSEQRLRGLPIKTPSEAAEAEVLDHWRARNSLARYRMHSKSAWFTLSLVLLYLALLLAAASVL